MLKKIFITCIGAALLLLAVVLINTVRFVPNEPSNVTAKAELANVNPERIAQNLSRAIQFKTVSYQDQELRESPHFKGFIKWLEVTYPKAHLAMSKTMISGLTPLYKWEGTDPTLKPILLAAHYDVVPIISGTEDDWQQPPFSGAVSGGYVWGRGALDDKVAVITMLEAVESLVSQGVKPSRTIYFSFGHDEEIGGQQGAAKVVEHLRQEGIQFAWSLDEGSMVIQGLVPGLDKPIASINVAEKGYLTLDITARAAGGHSSMPPKQTAVDILAVAINRLHSHQVDGGLSGVSETFFTEIAHHFSFRQRIFFANQWLFSSLLENELSKTPASRAMLLTTTAPTMLSASIKENVLPIKAVATVNFRIHPRDTSESILKHVRDTIADDRVELTVGKTREASRISDHRVAGYKVLSATVLNVFDSAIVAPGLTVAGTDTKHYEAISDNSYRIHPLLLNIDDVPRIHGTNERVSIENLKRAVQFYSLLLMNPEPY